MENKLRELLEKEVNPVLAEHNGGCELVSLEDGVASIRLTGGCTGCPGKKFTFMNSIKPFLENNVEGLKNVKLV